ncbi:hypothetical protein EDD22DRAFT_847741 [Suillus occidentalis]|nr:hypothetical protein EDD22DRAFT_847741 [Suillus occidentalis]
MGTPGCYVYRYQNMYFAYYRRYDSYPEGLGVEMLQCLRLSHAITKKQQELEEMLDELNGQSLPQEFDDLIICNQQSNFDDMDKSLMDVSWIYVIDFDHNVFRVNGIPFYSLEFLPEPEDFLEHVVNDFYDNLACAPECPPKYKYKRPAAPVVDDSDLKTYGSLVCTGPDASLSGLLSINDTLSTNEQMFDVRSMFAHPTKRPSRKEFIWAREDTVICLATHLDNERCLQASMSRLIKTILEQRDAPVVKDAYTTTFSHTTALQFLPSFFSESPSTPGITALARLGYRIDPALFICSLILGLTAHHPASTQQHRLLNFGKKSLFISICKTSSYWGWFQSYAVKQPRRYSATRMSLVIACFKRDAKESAACCFFHC